MVVSVRFDLAIDIPSSLHHEAEQQAKIAYIMTLLKYGEMSSGTAGKLLGISRVEFFDLMAQYGVPVLPDRSREELEQEVRETLELLNKSPS